MQYKADRLLKDLFHEYVNRPSQLPPWVNKRIKEAKDDRERIVCDYIAGMTDRFALDEHRKGLSAVRVLNSSWIGDYLFSRRLFLCVSAGGLLAPPRASESMPWG